MNTVPFCANPFNMCLGQEVRRRKDKSTVNGQLYGVETYYSDKTRSRQSEENSILVNRSIRTSFQ